MDKRNGGEPDVMDNKPRARRLPAWNGPLSTLLGMSAAVLVGWSLTQLPPLEGIAFVGLLAVVIGALIEPFIGLGAALFLGPLKAYLSIEVPQIPAQIGHAFIALALGSWLMRRLSARDMRIHHVSSPMFLSLLSFLGIALLSLWDAAGLVAHGVPELVKWIEIVLLFIFVKEHLAEDTAPSPTRESGTRTNVAIRRLQWLTAILIGAGAFQAFIGIWQFGLRGEGPEHFRILGGDFFRAYGTFEQPNPYGGYLGLTAALALGIVLEATGSQWVSWTTGRENGTGIDQPTSGAPLTCLSSSKTSLRRLSNARSCPGSRVVTSSHDPTRARWRPTSLPLYVLSSGAFGAMLFALTASWSRGAWLGFGAAALTMTTALPRRAVWSILLVLVLVVGGVGVFASGRLPAPFAARLTSFVQDIRLEDVRGVPINDANYAVIERLAHWQAALSMLRYHLWTGVGLGCYEAAYPSFALINWPIALGHAHNIYLNLAAETGLMGVAAYLFLWGIVLWQTWRMTRRARGILRGLAIGLLGAWTQISVHHILDNLYVNNVHLHIGTLLGMTAYIIQQTDRIASTYDR